MTKPDDKAHAPIPALSLDHVAHVVPNLEAAGRFYRETYGCPVSTPVTIAAQQIRIAYAEFANARIELIEPLGDGSPVSGFLRRTGIGGLHHVCFTTADADEAANAAQSAGLRLAGSDRPHPGHHGRPLFFLNPKDTLGALTEIETGEKQDIEKG